MRMRRGASTTGDTESAGMSPTRLRFGAALIISWLLPFWALAPFIAHALDGLSNPPSVAAVTTTIVVLHYRRPAWFLGRRNGSQVDRQGLQPETCNRGHLVDTRPRGRSLAAPFLHQLATDVDVDYLTARGCQVIGGISVEQYDVGVITGPELAFPVTESANLRRT